ncbi:MAG: ChaN family lipoprotein [Deltaproteobacteria bacterium]|nr:ChaN family lipoprotein [Deltaproteobacteria bacterium]
MYDAPMVLAPRQELLRLERQLYRRNKELIDNSVLIREPGFRRYETRYRRKVSRYASIVSQEEMVDAVRAADLIYVGDYHTCNQSQRSFLRILKAVVPTCPQLLIGMELLHRRSQPLVEAFLAGELAETAFLRKVGLRRRWVFDLWGNFKPVFDFARYHKIPVVGIDAAPAGASLKARDRAAGRWIAQLICRYPKHKCFIFIGDLHLAPQHLPAEVERSLAAIGLKKRPLLLYQNSEAIYWRLAEEGLDHQVEVVKLDEQSFCRMHAPPVICQQSYLNWLEHEEGEIDYADAKHQFLELVDRITAFLELTLGPEKEQVEVYTCGDLSFLKVLREDGVFSPHEVKLIRRQILASESYYIAKRRMVYLANLSLNHAAEEAAHFIKHCVAGAEEPRELVDAFYANVLHEGLGFFGSKLINPKRKCLHERELNNLRAYFETIRVPTERRLEYETARLVMEYKRFERAGKPLKYQAIFRQRPDIFFAVTHAIGYMLGDRLYYGMLEERITKEAIREIFLQPWRREGETVAVYLQLWKQLRGVKIPKRM